MLAKDESIEYTFICYCLCSTDGFDERFEGAHGEELGGVVSVLYLEDEDVVNSPSYEGRSPVKYSHTDRPTCDLNTIENKGRRQLVEYLIFLGIDPIQPRLWILFTNRRDPSPCRRHFLPPPQRAAPPLEERTPRFPWQRALRLQMQMDQQDMP